jgi:hypothetical protein|tara:strand:+ start:2179 stop:2682 length:504 start_codon:yes stop_codon:yes gene_type:complete
MKGRKMSKDFIFRGTDKKGEHSAMCISEKELMELDLIINFRNGFHWIIDIGCRESINNHSMVFPKGAIMVTDGHEDMGKVNSYPYCQFCIYYASMNDHTDEMITRIEKYLKKKYKDHTIKVVDDGSKEYDDMWMDLEVKINKQSNADKETVSVANRIANGEKITYPF